MRLTEAEKQDVIQATLQWCNERRAEKKKEPISDLPKGRRYDGESCPCGRATGLFVGRQKWGKTGAFLDIKHPLPAKVTDFIMAFDHGNLPEYEEGA